MINSLFKLPNVVVVGRGHKVVGDVDTGRDAVVVGVVKKVSLKALAMADMIPKRYEGKETDVIEVGEIKALRTTKHRPAPGGVSIGHYAVTAGTLGMVVKKTWIRYILSNNHVLANSNDAEIGDSIYQPGRIDGGTEQDTIAYLYDFVPISMGDSNCPVARVIVSGLNFIAEILGRKTRLRAISLSANKVDCAIAKPIKDADIDREIIEIGIPSGFGVVDIGSPVKKSGRTSGLNYGAVVMMDATSNVSYPSGMATFEDQVLTTAIAEPGDSGSVVLTDDNKVIGLLFAGSDQVTIVNKIDNVIDALGLDRN